LENWAIEKWSETDLTFLFLVKIHFFAPRFGPVFSLLYTFAVNSSVKGLPSTAPPIKISCPKDLKMRVAAANHYKVINISENFEIFSRHLLPMDPKSTEKICNNFQLFAVYRK